MSKLGFTPVAFEDWIAANPEHSEWTTSKCQHCNGEGEVECCECGQDRECPQCGGDGEIDTNAGMAVYLKQIEVDREKWDEHFKPDCEELRMARTEDEHLEHARPCPLSGCARSNLYMWHGTFPAETMRYAVRCRCGASGPPADTMAAAVERWGTT